MSKNSSVNLPNHGIFESIFYTANLGGGNGGRDSSEDSTKPPIPGVLEGSSEAQLKD